MPPASLCRTRSEGPSYWNVSNAVKVFVGKRYSLICFRQNWHFFVRLMIDFSPAKANTAFRKLDDGRTFETLDQKIE